MVTLQYQAIKILLLNNYKFMTKFQFHSLLALGFLHLSQDATGFYYKFFMVLFAVFVLFLLIDVYKEEQKKYFAPKH